MTIGAKRGSIPAMNSKPMITTSSANGSLGRNGG